MLPARPYSSLIAASSARVAGGEASYPTTRYRFAAGGGVAFITAKAIRFSARRPGIRPADGMTGLVHPSWRSLVRVGLILRRRRGAPQPVEVRRRGRDRGRHRLMRHVDRPAPGRLVSRGLRLLAAGRPTGLPTAGRPSGLLTVTGLLTASRGAAVLLIGLFQGDLFPDGLIFPRGLLISQFLAGRLAGPRFPAGRLTSPRFLAGRLTGLVFLIG